MRPVLPVRMEREWSRAWGLQNQCPFEPEQNRQQQN